MAGAATVVATAEAMAFPFPRRGKENLSAETSSSNVELKRGRPKLIWTPRGPIRRNLSDRAHIWRSDGEMDFNGGRHSPFSWRCDGGEGEDAHQEVGRQAPAASSRGATEGGPHSQRCVVRRLRCRRRRRFSSRHQICCMSDGTKDGRRWAQPMAFAGAPGASRPSTASSTLFLSNGCFLRPFPPFAPAAVRAARVAISSSSLLSGSACMPMLHR